MNASSFTILDWLLLALLAASTVRALVRGFLLEIFSLAGATAGVLLASWNYNALALQLVDWLSPFTTLNLATADLIAFLLILTGVIVLAGLAGKLLRSSAGAIGLGLVDRLLGAAFGLARGCLLGVAGIMLLTAFDPNTRIVENSQLLPYFLAGARGVSFVVPESFQRQLADGAERIKHNKAIWINPPQ
jgi:membrane protein required for colicin V production